MRLLHFSDLHLGVETYGHIDPATGLSSRLQDFLAALDQVVDYALNNHIHLVLFCGDAYKSREPSPTQQREFARRIGRLASAGIPVLLLVGNHDQPQAFGKATAVDIFDTLAIRHIIVADKPGIYPVETAAGPVQVVALPWLRRSAFLARDEAKGLSFEEINDRMRQKLTEILHAQIDKLPASGVPAVLAAHVWVDVAKPSGSERMLSLGGEPQVLLSALAGSAVGGCPAFSYVALGHIHRHQVLSQRPVVAYSGSLERLDFREEAEEKGFVVVEVEGAEARLEFHPVSARRFLTIEVKLDARDSDPTAAVLRTIDRYSDKIGGAIVRVNITLPGEVEGLVRESDIRSDLLGRSASYVAAIAREVKREPRLRLGGMAVEKMSPLRALEEYLKQRKVDAQRLPVLLEYGQKLLQEESQEA